MLTLALSLGCGGDTAPEARSDPAGQAGPLYLIASAFITGDQRETYLVTSRTFDETTVVNPTDGPRLQGGVAPVVHGGKVFAPESQAPVLTRFDVGADDKLVKGAELSFAGVGMTSLQSAHVYVVSDSKGYAFDPAGPRIVVWNPSTMTLTGKQIDLRQIARTGFTPNLNLEFMGPHRRGNQLVVPLSWNNQDGNARFASGMVVLDVETDALLAVDEDERCGESFTTIATKNGDLYMFPPAWSSIVHYFAENHRPTCVVKLPAGAMAFDDGAPLDLSALGTGRAASSGIPDGAGGFFLLTVDETAWNARKSDVDPFWRMFHYDLDAKRGRPVTTVPVWAGQAYYVNVGDQVFIVYWEETSTGNRTTLYRVNGTNDPVRVFAYDASWYGFSRIR